MGVVVAIVAPIIKSNLVPAVPAWLAPAAWGTVLGVVASWAIGKLLGREPPISNPLEFLSSDFASDDREQTTFKRKLNLIFRNKSDLEIVVGPKTEWIAGDLQVSTLPEHLWRVEGPGGWQNGDWSPEAVAVRVPPGKRLRTWVGLPNNATKVDVDRYVVEHGAGALSCSIVRVNDLRIDL